jgi:hypothetical protein
MADGQCESSRELMSKFSETEKAEGGGAVWVAVFTWRNLYSPSAAYFFFLQELLKCVQYSSDNLCYNVSLNVSRSSKFISSPVRFLDQNPVCISYLASFAPRPLDTDGQAYTSMYPEAPPDNDI